MSNFRIYRVMLASAVLAMSTTSWANDKACDVQRGKVVYETCQVCHSIERDKGHGVAPNLYGILGSAVGKQVGFKYSKRMRKSEANWSESHFKAFIANPMQTYPGTMMAFAGLKKQRDRDDLTCYLQTQR